MSTRHYFPSKKIKFITLGFGFNDSEMTRSRRVLVRAKQRLAHIHYTKSLTRDIETDEKVKENSCKVDYAFCHLIVYN